MTADDGKEHVRGVREGWRLLVRDALAELRTIAHEGKLGSFAVAQVKPKLENLRISVKGYQGVRDRIGPAIRAARDRAAVTCELCGCPGTLRVNCAFIQTLCDRHAEARW